MALLKGWFGVSYKEEGETIEAILEWRSDDSLWWVYDDGSPDVCILKVGSRPGTAAKVFNRIRKNYPKLSGRYKVLP